MSVIGGPRNGVGMSSSSVLSRRELNIINAMPKLQSQSTTNPSSISQAAAVEALNATQDFIKSRAESFK